MEEFKSELDRVIGTYVPKDAQLSKKYLYERIEEVAQTMAREARIDVSPLNAVHTGCSGPGHGLYNKPDAVWLISTFHAGAWSVCDHHKQWGIEEAMKADAKHLAALTSPTTTGEEL